ncbi:MAG: allantoicase [Pseudomonas sp.]
MNEQIRVAEPALLPDWAQNATNLADPRLGARALHASDAFFGPVERMLQVEPARFVVGKFDDHGKWMDGWETRRRRAAGHDWCVVRLGCVGQIAGFDVDTSHFHGNCPPAVSIEAVRCDSDEPEVLDGLSWTEILPATPLQPNSHHLLRCADQGDWSHLRIRIYPDGGIARLRVYGRPAGLAGRLDEGAEVDLLALENGGRPVAWNDAHFGAVGNLILPGRGVNMGDGWETRRRREPGNDWCILALGAAGKISRVELDTAHFKGNYPDRFSLQAANVEPGKEHALVNESLFWPELLAPQPLSMDAVHSFSQELVALGPITHVRLNIYPDGGVSRLRLWGRPAHG